MPYLVCEKCGGYYKLQKGESPEDFISKCPCGGELIYVQYMDSGEKPGEKPSATQYLRAHLFKISMILAVIIILIILSGIFGQGNAKFNDNTFFSNENEKYNDEQINIFLESAFNPDYNGRKSNAIGKWNINFVRIKVMGTPTKEDLKTLNDVIIDINNNAKTFQMKIDDYNIMEADIEIYFIPHSEFPKYNVPQKFDGFTSWRVSTSDVYGGNPAGEIYKARVFVGIDGLSQSRRSHVIVHEMCHSLGLHHNHNQNSVLCDKGPDITGLTDLDKSMIRILYRKDIPPNMPQNQVESILNRSKKSLF